MQLIGGGEVRVGGVELLELVEAGDAFAAPTEAGGADDGGLLALAPEAALGQQARPLLGPVGQSIRRVFAEPSQVVQGGRPGPCVLLPAKLQKSRVLCHAWSLPYSLGAEREY
jgi:hypothetical protein